MSLLNMVKTTPDQSPTTSSAPEPKYKGVRKRKWGKYVCEIRLPNSRDRIWLGSYDSGEKAARAFDAALFCLRGPGAGFNFPHDPPDIAGGRGLSPAEIQAVAQHYGNSYSVGGGGSGNDRQPQPPTQAVELEDDNSPSSNSEGPGPADSIDWSFLDMLDCNSNGHENAGHVSDFGLFHEPGDMYMPQHMDEEDDEGADGHGNGGIEHSFLWNF